MVIKKLTGYGGVAIIAASVDLLFGCIARYLIEWSYFYAFFVGFSFGALANFIGCEWFLFSRFKRTRWQAWVRHFISSLISLLLNLLVMVLLIEYAVTNSYLYARLFAMIVSFFISFTLIRYFAFQDHLAKGDGLS